MNPAAIIIGLLLAVIPAGAATIDMNAETPTQPKPAHAFEAPVVIGLLNDDPYVHLFIDGYERVGVRFGQEAYTVHVENDQITKIVPGISGSVDYEVGIGFEEALYLYASRAGHSKVELLRLAVLEKAVPIRVVMRFAGAFMKNG